MYTYIQYTNRRKILDLKRAPHRIFIITKILENHANL